MSEPDVPSVPDLQALEEQELRALIRELLNEPAIIAQADETGSEIWSIDGVQIVVLFRRVRRNETPLAGVSLPALVRKADLAGAQAARIFTTGIYDAEQRVRLDEALHFLTESVAIDVVDAAAIRDLVLEREEVRARFFPSEREAQVQAEQRQIPRWLLWIGEALTAPRPASEALRTRRGWLRLVFLIAASSVLIAIPIHVTSTSALWVGGAVLALVATVALASFRLERSLSRSVDWVREPVLDALLPDALSLRRHIERGSLSKSRLMRAIGWMIPLAILRTVVRSGVLLFFLTFTAIFLVIWGSDPQVMCHGTAVGGSFAGSGTRPTVGDFLFLAIQCGFFNQPGDLQASSRIAHAAVTTEFLAAAALLVGYAAAFGIPPNLWRAAR